MSFVIREFKTGSIAARGISTYAEGFDKCIELYIKSEKRRSFYVCDATAVPRVKAGYGQ